MASPTPQGHFRPLCRAGSASFAGPTKQKIIGVYIQKITTNLNLCAFYFILFHFIRFYLSHFIETTTLHQVAWLAGGFHLLEQVKRRQEGREEARAC